MARCNKGYHKNKRTIKTYCEIAKGIVFAEAVVAYPLGVKKV